MRKTKAQKGITLIALIITIVVLLILAAVTIRAMQGDGIISKAEEAKAKTEQAQAEEEQRLLEYEYQIAKSQGTATGTYDEYVLEKKYGLKIGDYVNYKYDKLEDGYPLSATYSGYTGGDQIIKQPTTPLQWRVLGIDQKRQCRVNKCNTGREPK
ncbi:MAG: hypothetical protein ACI4UE_06395 [Candidatus Scatovivens sp.]